MGKHALCNLQGCVYDVDTKQFVRQPDLVKLEEFCTDGTHSNMMLTYDTERECKNRRYVLNAWLDRNGYKNDYYISVRKNNLLVIKERI